MLRFALLVAVGLFSSTALAAPPSIQWGFYDFPPFEIHGGPLENRGLVDLGRVFMQQHLPGYRHVDVGPMNQDRLLKLFRTGNFCHAGLIRLPVFEQHAYLSYTIGIMPNKTLLTTRRVFQNKLGARQNLSFRQLLTNPNLLMGRSPQALGAELDPVFAAHVNPHTVYYRMAIDQMGLIAMLSKQRLDYLIGFPAEAMYWNQLHPENPIISVPLAETQGTYAQGRMACSKNAWGREVIRQINRQLLQHRLEASYIAATTLPWVPAEQQPQYLKDYQRIVGADHWSNAE